MESLTALCVKSAFSEQRSSTLRVSPKGLTRGSGHCAVFGVFVQVFLGSSEGDFQMTTEINIRRVFMNSVRVYFAPLTGAYKGIREELRRTDPWRKHRSDQRSRHHVGSSRTRS